MTPDVIDAICESLAVNPSWPAAADFAGVPDSTVRNWRQRGEQFANKIEGDESVADLDGRRMFVTARELWQNGNFYGSQRLILRLMQRTERDPDLCYYEFVQRANHARSRGEHELINVIVGVTKSKSPDRWRAALALLRMYGRPEYLEKFEISGSVEISTADAEARALKAIETFEQRQADG